MKRFTIIFSLLLVLSFVGVMLYVNALPEFTPPGPSIEKEDPDAPVWNMSMDDLIAYLVEQGFLDSKDDLYLLSEGIASEAYGFDGAEIYWWDLDALEADSDEGIAYDSMMKDHIIDLWGSGNIMSITGRGPFGLALTYYEGDADALMEAFQAFGK